MHIPEGYLSPQTCAVAATAMLPIWAIANKKVTQTFGIGNVPKLAIGAAFAFVIMMFNIPIPDGTTGHAIGATLLAIVLGPWAATICMTIALAIQALFFGDGGVLAIGANSFNIAFLAPFVGYTVYKLALRVKANKVFAAFIGSYIGIQASALGTAVMLGLQPLLFQDPSGNSLYFPYPLKFAIPAMMFAHLTVAGFVEATVTALVIYYLERVGESSILHKEESGFNSIEKTIIALVFLTLLTPLGLLASGNAWGEWGLGEIKDKLGFVPAGMERFAVIVKSTIPDYEIPGFSQNFLQSSLGYIASAFIGMAAIALFFFVFGKVTRKVYDAK